MAAKPSLTLAPRVRAHPVEGQVCYLQTEAGALPFVVRMVVRGRNGGYRVHLESATSEQKAEMERLGTAEQTRQRLGQMDALRAATPWILGQQLAPIATMLLALPRWRRVAVRWGLGVKP